MRPRCPKSPKENKSNSGCSALEQTGTAFISWGCHNKVPQAEEWTLSPFWRPTSETHVCVGGVPSGVSASAGDSVPGLAQLLVVSNPRHCRITLMTALCSCGFSLCVSGSKCPLLMRSPPVILDQGATLLQYDLTLTHYTCNNPIYK